MFTNDVLLLLSYHGAQFQRLVSYKKEQTVNGEDNQMSEH
jgi:hypothetical protein